MVAIIRWRFYRMDGVKFLEENAEECELLEEYESIRCCNQESLDYRLKRFYKIDYDIDALCVCFFGAMAQIHRRNDYFIATLLVDLCDGEDPRLLYLVSKEFPSKFHGLSVRKFIEGCVVTLFERYHFTTLVAYLDKYGL